MADLAEIRDIYIPDGVSFWPPAYGWWVILILVIGLFFLFKLIRWSIRTSKRIYALKKLKNIDEKYPVIAGMQISELLRRICFVKYKEARTLYSRDWVYFLNEHCPIKLDEKAANLLMFSPFMQKNDKSYSVETAIKLKEFCKQFIGANL